MSYPNSNDVSSGQPTAYQHYNNLRADALRFGQSAADSANLGEILSLFEDNLNLQYLATQRLRVPASAASPVSLVIDGSLLKAITNVDLATGAAPSGLEAQYYVFAQRTAGSTSFTLTCNTSINPSAGQKLIGRFYWTGSAIIPGSIVTEKARYLETLMSILASQTPCGRLTLASSDPYPQNITGSTVYYTPYRGNRIALYAVGRGWRAYEFSELSVSCTGWSYGRPRDIFLFLTASGTLTLETIAWTNDTTRAVPLFCLDGVLVNGGGSAGDYSHRYLGTVRTSATGVVADTTTQRLVYNEYNPLPHVLKQTDATDHTYALTTLRYWNNDSNQAFGLMLGNPRQLRGGIDGLFRNSAGTNASYVCCCLNDAAGANLASINHASSTYLKAGNGFVYDAPAGYTRFAMCEAAGASATLSAANMSISMLVEM